MHFWLHRLASKIPIWVWVGLLFGVLAVHSYRLVTRISQPGKVSFQNQGYIDFQNAIYFPGKYFLEGNNPYSQDYTEQHPAGRSFPLFPPHSLLLHLPFSLFSPSTACVVYFVFQLGMLGVLVGWIGHDVGWPINIRTMSCLGSLLMLTVPFYQNFYLGQLTLQIVLGSMLALRYSHDRPWLAGIGLALAATKPQFGVIIAILLLFRGDWKNVFIGAGISMAGSLIGLLFLWNNVGFDSFCNDLYSKYFALGSHPELGHAFENFRRIDLYPVWERLAGNAIPNWIKVFQTAALIGLAGLAVSKTRHQRSDDARLLSNLMIMLTSLIAIYHSNYDGLLLFWPLVIWFGGEKLVNTSSRQKTIMFVLLASVMINVFSLSRFLNLVGPEYSPAWYVAASTTSITLATTWGIAFWTSMTLSPKRSL